jgi:hypothetical protein
MRAVLLFSLWSGLPLDACMDGWTFTPYERDGEVVAIAATDGPEIHFAIAPGARHTVIARHRTAEFLAPLFERHGYLTTRTAPDAPQRDFLTRLGFHFTWNSGEFDHYMLAALPWAKEN